MSKKEETMLDKVIQATKDKTDAISKIVAPSNHAPDDATIILDIASTHAALFLSCECHISTLGGIGLLPKDTADMVAMIIHEAGEVAGKAMLAVLASTTDEAKPEGESLH